MMQPGRVAEVRSAAHGWRASTMSTPNSPSACSAMIIDEACRMEDEIIEQGTRRLHVVRPVTSISRQSTAPWSFGGSGAVGALLVERLAAAGVATMHVVDRRSPGVPAHVDVDSRTTSAGRATHTLRLIESADLVILATPEQVAIAGLGACLATNAAWLAAGRHPVGQEPLRAGARGGATQAELLGINPMFAPSLGFAGRSVVAVPYAAGERPRRSWISSARRAPTSCASAPRSTTAPVPRCRSRRMRQS